MKDPIDTYPRERMIALSCPENFGTNINHLRQMNPAWALMHDASPCGGVFNDVAFSDWGIAKGDVTFIPYWRNSHVVQSAPNGLLVSIWRRPGSAVLGICNYGRGPGDEPATRAVQVALDLAALGVPVDAEGDRLRVRQFLNLPAEKRHLGHLLWYQDEPAREVKQAGPGKMLPPVTPKLDAKTGILDGFNLHFHDIRFIVIHWEEQAVDRVALARQFPGTLGELALDWGVNARDCERLDGTKSRKWAPLDDANVALDIWRRPGKVLLRFGYAGAKATTCMTRLDLASLGVQVGEADLWKKFTILYDLCELKPVGEAPKVSNVVEEFAFGKGAPSRDVIFNAWTGSLAVTLQPGQVRVLAIQTD